MRYFIYFFFWKIVPTSLSCIIFHESTFKLLWVEALLQQVFYLFWGVTFQSLHTELLASLLTSDEFPLYTKPSISHLLSAVITDLFPPNSFFPELEKKNTFFRDTWEFSFSWFGKAVSRSFCWKFTSVPQWFSWSWGWGRKAKALSMLLHSSRFHSQGGTFR